MKIVIELFVKGWLAVGITISALDASLLALCRLLERIGKPCQILSEVYNPSMYARAWWQLVIKWSVAVVAWPIGLVLGFLINNKREEAV